MEPLVCARCFWTVDRQWDVDGVKTLITKIDMTLSIEQQWGVVVQAMTSV